MLLATLAACGGQESSADSPAQAPQRPRAVAADATEILRRTEQRADATRTLEADFVQSLRVPLLNQNPDQRATHDVVVLRESNLLGR